MPKKQKAKAPKGMSPQEAARANQQGFDHAMNAVPLLQFDDTMGNFGTFTESIIDPFTELFNQVIGRGEQTTGMAPPAPEAPAQPQIDPYEARIQELMTQKGMTRAQAEANQASAFRQGGDLNNNGAVTNQEWAMKLGSDFNNDGNVSNQEWAQYQQQQQQQPQQAVTPTPVRQQPQPGAYQGVQLTPEQLASIQKFNRYGRGMA